MIGMFVLAVSEVPAADADSVAAASNGAIAQAQARKVFIRFAPLLDVLAKRRTKVQAYLTGFCLADQLQVLLVRKLPRFRKTIGQERTCRHWEPELVM